MIDKEKYNIWFDETIKKLKEEKLMDNFVKRLNLKPKSNYSWLWMFIAIVIGLSISGTILYGIKYDGFKSILNATCEQQICEPVCADMPEIPACPEIPECPECPDMYCNTGGE